jgi:hypothetical protein
VWVTAEYFARGSLQVKSPSVPVAEQTLDQIQSSTSIEELRRQAKLLAQMRTFDKQHQEYLGGVVQQMYRWFVTFMAIVIAVFLANAGVLYWVHLRERRAL